METPAVQARRANIEDLEALLALWESTGHPGTELEKYLTEFQVAVDEDGGLCGAIGLLATGGDGLMHTEAIREGAPGDEVRMALWNRMQIVARNQGMARIWTQEDAPYWMASGFRPARADEAATMPAAFADPDARWFVHELIDPTKGNRLVTEQMAIWDAARQQERDALVQSIARFRTFSLAFVAAIAGVILLMMVYILARKPDILSRLLGR